ncbi:hypothetical protein SUGI_0194720 [Cryptomeria japonica]|uniref:uncharacterized protein LOC131034082 n=1 Tax=Cryptomeria japonica TaxID=3369 RepID=UPI002408F1D9|nr:uncharacterized protein LOC131034082 [Cryptomeria japonica]GLJ12622.1 hypothetical protein SUGI_0194720 [Cryptomeria japonica]
MSSISRGIFCNFNQSSLNCKQEIFLQQKLYSGRRSKDSKKQLLQVKKIFALENNKDFSQLQPTVEPIERAGENTSTFGNNTVFTCSQKEIGNQPPKESNRNKELLQKLKRYGAAGVLSYGLLNTVYYLVAFLVVWFYIAPAPGGMGYFPAAQRFLKILAMVWAGSQVTKILRAGGALAVAPFVDQGLSWFTTKFRFKSRRWAFGAIVVICVGLVLSLFTTVTLLWA